MRNIGIVLLSGMLCVSNGGAAEEAGPVTNLVSTVTNGPAIEWPAGLLDWPALNAEAQAGTLQSIRPFVPGQTPLWHWGSSGFIYAPAFDIPETNGAACYRFKLNVLGPELAATNKADGPVLSLVEVWSRVPVGDYLVTITGQKKNGNRWGIPQTQFHKKTDVDKPAPQLQATLVTGAVQYAYVVCPIVRTLSFEAPKPWAPLSPVWKDVPEGSVILTVDGLDQAGGQSVGQVGVKRFYRERAFEGPGVAPVMTYREAARKSLEWQLQRPYCSQFSEDKDVYDLGKYPSKLTGLGMVHIGALYARLEPRPVDADKVLVMAKRAARALIAASTSTNSVLPYLPPTYRGEYGFKPDNIMMLYPALTAWMYLDLYDLTKEDEFLQAAVRIAETYKKTQLPDGSWPSIMAASTGKVISAVPLVLVDEPVMNVLGYFERLVKQYNRQEFKAMHDAAERYFLDGPVKEFRPQGLFEDGAPSAGNLSGNTAAGMAVYLLTHSRGADDVALAEDFLRLGEDQFVLWHRAPKGWTMTPSVMEQNAYRVPVCCSASFYMEGCLAAYQVTGKKLWLAKAIVMANAHVEFVNRIGMIPTLWLYGDSGWANCPAQSSCSLLRFDSAH